MTVQLADRLIWSPRSLGRSLLSKRHVSATLRVTGLIGLLIGLSVGLSVGLSFGLRGGLSYGLSYGLSFWLLFGLFQGVSSVTIEDQRRMVPNQGIRRSALNGLVLGLISAVIVGLLSWLSVGLLIGLSEGLSFVSVGLSLGLRKGLVIGLSAGLLAGLLNGELAWMRHSVIHLLLWRAGSIPWNYPHFLDFAAERLLLRQVGGGYIFLHRLLLDYFANLETGPGSDMSAESRQERLPSETVPSASVEPTGADERSAVSTLSLAPTPVVSEVARLLPCGHEGRPNARFCDVCGAPVPS